MTAKPIPEAYHYRDHIERTLQRCLDAREQTRREMKTPGQSPEDLRTLMVLLDRMQKDVTIARRSLKTFCQIFGLTVPK